ncbi:MAG: iron complex outermembrane recepter protein [Gammaproteobacteria bacterium]|nr:MAG: iron complex outermembrane recepter protein [Gammaproteobacteria bacterium]TND02675.1 MAG: iron complex outermembrane recepter protein [Gammaproteobacteria bacterium]
MSNRNNTLFLSCPPARLLPLAAMMAGLTFNASAEEPAPTDEPTLPTVTVNADADAPRDGLRATTTRVGKTLQDPHDVPQAVTTVTRTLMDEQKASSLREAMRNVSGLTFNAAEGGRAGDNMMLRGFYTFGDMYLDGIRDTAQYNRELFNLEQVDVLRGAAAMLFGRGQAGGVINQVSKMPFLADRHEIGGGVGTDDYRLLTGDFNKRLASTTAVRVNLMTRDEGSWRSNPATGDEPEIHRDGVAMSVGHGLNTDNEYLFSHVTTLTDDKPDNGISFDTNTRAPNTNFPPETYWSTYRNFDESDTNITTGTYTHRFSPMSSWRTQLRVADYERSYWARTPSATQAPNAQGVVIGNNGAPNGGPTRTMDYETVALQTDYNNAFQAWDMKHEFLVGAEYFKEDSFRHSLQNEGGTTAGNPPFYLPYHINSTGTPVEFDSGSYGLYAQDTVEFIPRWKATLGARRDYMDADYSSATSPRLKYGEWSTRAALSFHPADETHYYVSTSDSFSPTADLYQLTASPLPPERSQVLELGAKWLLFEGDLALRAAIYRADKDWERNTDLESTAAILTKKRRTDGVELEAAGRVTDRWEVFAGMALMDSEILEVAENVNPTTGAITVANSGYQGQRARNTPPYTANVWTTYKVVGGWKVGGGAEAKGERYGYNPSGAGAVPTLPGDTAFHPNTLPSYVRWDAMVSYEQQRYSVALNAQNLFDKVYYDSLYDNGGFAVPGLGRRLILSGEYKF